MLGMQTCARPSSALRASTNLSPSAHPFPKGSKSADVPRGGNTELSEATQVQNAKPGAAATAMRKAAHIKAKRADGAKGGDWANSRAYWASMNKSGYYKK